MGVVVHSNKLIMLAFGRLRQEDWKFGTKVGLYGKIEFQNEWGK